MIVNVTLCAVVFCSAALAGCSSTNDGKLQSSAPSNSSLQNPSSTPVYADRVVTDGHMNAHVPPATMDDWHYFYQPSAVLGPPGGTADVFSLGYDSSIPQPGALGGFIVVGLGDSGGHRCAVDGDGPDLTVYENPFATVDADGNAGTYNEVATVEVSQDGNTWYLFPPSENTALPLVDPARYHNLAGVTEMGKGGDRFDLNDLKDVLPAEFMACYVRITDGGTQIADYGNTQTDTWDSGADIDAVEALYSVSAPAGLAP